MVRLITALLLHSIGSGCAKQTYRDCPNVRVGWQPPADYQKSLVVRPNVIRIHSDGRLHWNGRQVTGRQLLDHLTSVRQLAPTPQTVLTADDNASCEAVEEIRTEMERIIGCEDGRCAEAGYST